MPVDSKRLRGAGQRSQLCHNERSVVRFAREQHASRLARAHMLRFAARRARIDLGVADALGISPDEIWDSLKTEVK